jgi:hypothetical protein
MWSLVEYVSLRLIRKFFFTERLLTTIGSWVPYYRTNYNQFNPGAIVDKYERKCRSNGYELQGQVVLELGAGATNSTCYELSARKCETVYAFEPYAHFHDVTDRKLLASISRIHAEDSKVIANRVHRINDLTQISHRTVDIIFSNSVLEHVHDPDTLFETISGYMSESSIMIHFVDYRDHFFKYPYHFLLFSKKTWERWLNPGDLYRWRLGDHRRLLARAGYSVKIDDIKRDTEQFVKIKNRISSDLNADDPDINVTECTIIAHRGELHSTTTTPRP